MSSNGARSIDGIFCINLASRPDRWQRMEQRFAKHGIEVERFEAVTPADERVQRLGKQCGHETRTDLCIIASTQSHLDVYAEALRRGLKCILVLEDDVRFHRDWKTILAAQMAVLDFDDATADWCLIMLNAMRRNVLWPEPHEGRWDRTFGEDVMAAAYVVTDDGMRKMLQQFSVRGVIPPDSMTVWLQETGKAYVHMPWLAVQEHDDSDVQENSHNDRIRRWHEQFYYPMYGFLYDDSPH